MIKSAYIHIPFCETICAYCDFCKFYYQKEWVSPYLKALKKEIETSYQNEVLDTLYVGGGTPSSLSLEELKELLEILKQFRMSKHIEYTMECNIENLTKEKLMLMKEYGVNRLSIGVQTFQKDALKLIERNHTKEEVFEKMKWAKEIGFTNINVDLMYALPKETIQDLKNDLDIFLKLDIPHISTYSLIIEPHTKFSNLKPISEDLDYEMYQLIEHTLEKKGYDHYETSNYGKKGYFSKHNLTYWNNEEYYGFGVGASGYVRGVRYDNTRNLTAYLKENFIKESHELGKLETMQNEMILGLRKLKGVSKKKFFQKYKEEIEDVFDIKEPLKNGMLVFKNGYYYIPKKYQYVANEVLVYFI